MNYDFHVKAETKADAINQANEQLDAVLAAQPMHAADMPAARQAVEAFTNLLVEDPACYVVLSISGSIHFYPEGLRYAGITIRAGVNLPKTQSDAADAKNG